MTRDEIFAIRRQHRANIPGLHHEAYRKNWDEAMRGKRLMACIKAKCLDCMCWQSAEVKACTCVGCPLYEVRPYVSHPQRKVKTPRPRKLVGTPPNESVALVARSR
jgi:hypothetical protein